MLYICISIPLYLDHFLGSVLPPYMVYVCVCVCVISQFFSNIPQRCTTQYDVARLILMSIIYYWLNSTLFSCKVSFFMTKIYYLNTISYLNSFKHCLVDVDKALKATNTLTLFHTGRCEIQPWLWHFGQADQNCEVFLYNNHKLPASRLDSGMSVFLSLQNRIRLSSKSILLLE